MGSFLHSLTCRGPLAYSLPGTPSLLAGSVAADCFLGLRYQSASHRGLETTGFYPLTVLEAGSLTLAVAGGRPCPGPPSWPCQWPFSS